MAMVPVGTKSCVYTFKDNDNNTASLTVFAPATVLTEDVGTWATTTGLTTIQALSDAVIVGLSVNQKYEENAPADAGESSDVERKMRTTYKAASGARSTFRVPSIKNSLVVDETNTVNPAAAEVIAFHAMMIDATLFDIVGLGNYLGSPLVAKIGPSVKVHKGSNEG